MANNIYRIGCENMINQFSEDFTLKRIIKFTLPSIIMMMFFSLYTIIDGIFISNYVGTIALGALNIIYPFQCLCIGLSIMIAAGGSAIVAKKLGENENHRAKSLFTMFIALEITIAIIVLAFGIIFKNQIVDLLGASDLQRPYALRYYIIYLSFLPFIFLQNAFQTLFVTAGEPKLGLFLIILAGIINILLDYLFLGVVHMSIEGAAFGTVIACMIPSCVGLLYFTFNRNGILYFVKFKFDFKNIKDALINGSSEMVTNLANAITTFLFNMQCMKFYGEDGVAAITIVLYFQFLFSAIFFGYSTGIAPVMSFKFGSGNKKQLRYIYSRSLILVLIISIIGFIASHFLIYPVSSLFAGSGSNVYNIVIDNFKYYSLSLLLFGTSIFASSYFTSLGNGIVSAVISFSRTILFLTISLIVLPLLFKELGIWISVPVAESIGVVVSIICFVKYKRKYLFYSED